MKPGSDAQSTLLMDPNPHHTDDPDWLRRSTRRQAAVAAIKKKQLYVNLTFARMQGTANGDEPTTPDPTDRLISKRSWEKHMQDWRRALNKWNGKAEAVGSGSSGSGNATG